MPDDRPGVRSRYRMRPFRLQQEQLTPSPDEPIPQLNNFVADRPRFKAG
jgi:hypothetical protein